MKLNTNKEFFKEHEYVILVFAFGVMTLITLLTPIVNAAVENMTITSDTSSVEVGVVSDVTFTVTRVCGSEPDDGACATINPPPIIGAKDVSVSLSGSASGSGTTDADGQVTIPVNATRMGVVIATASKYGYKNTKVSIPVLYSEAPTPTPTPPINETCGTRDVDMGSQSSYTDNSQSFGLDFTATKAAWNVTWYVNETAVKNESNISAISSISPIGQLGTINVTANTVNNNCRIVNYKWIWTVTQKPTSSSSGGSSSSGSSGSSSGGSGGGGGVSSPEPYYNIVNYMSKENDITTGKTTVYPFSHPNFAIYEIDIIANQSDNDVNVRLEHLKNLSLTADKIPAGIIYANENIWINSKRIGSMHIKFKVSNSWIANNNLSKEDIKLLKYTGNWWKLNTQITGNDTTYTYFEAMSPTPSVYAISGLKDALKLSDNPNSTINNESIANTGNNTLQNAVLEPLTKNNVQDVKTLQMVGLVTILAFLLVIGIVARKIVRKVRK